MAGRRVHGVDGLRAEIPGGGKGLRRKLLAMWPVRVARSPHLDMLPQVVRAGAWRQRPYDEDVLKNKDFLNRRLYSTIRSDHQHGPNAMSRCAYVLVGFG